MQLEDIRGKMYGILEKLLLETLIFLSKYETTFLITLGVSFHIRDFFKHFYFIQTTRIFLITMKNCKYFSLLKLI